MYVQQNKNQAKIGYGGYGNFGGGLVTRPSPWNNHPGKKDFQRYVAGKDPSIAGDWFSAENHAKVTALWGPWLQANPIPAGWTPPAQTAPTSGASFTSRQMSPEEIAAAQAKKDAAKAAGTGVTPPGSLKARLMASNAPAPPPPPPPPPDNTTKYLIAAGAGLVLILGAVFLMKK